MQSAPLRRAAPPRHARRRLAPPTAGAPAVTTVVPTGNTYDTVASTNPIERWRMAGFFAALDEGLPATPPATVLEVGIGEGEVSARLRERYPEATFVGVDLPDDDLAREWAGHEFAGLFGDIARL